ncbi:gfo/Idh/MocA family oxidoreductase [Lacihabitans sp. LS3-19]|uniref:Gfo/Idh/MocA family protein n=1 Tax=Lacihabitans sp. LS3-19 TaxID=2487335 RepID=UPI0020CDAF0B|nr:Gfo/Idh/MocA family oxidoreductase [Lacihabitans sp. LS3-19]MCP9766524.1 gfo/Idh/MocA family oxidoreductase [Lacihabitans sp. LS3-19]
MKKAINRRSFIKGITATSAIIPAIALANPAQKYEGKKIKVALVGLGRYAEYMVAQMKDCEYCEVSALVSGTPSKLESWGKEYKVPVKNRYNYQNFDAIKDNPDIDLVYIILPNAMHKEYAIRAARAKKHVLVEKPMAVSAADCLEMIKVCKENNVQLAMGYRLHFEPYNMEMMRLGQKEVFGKVRVVEASLGYFAGEKGEWRLNKKLAGGGPLMNLGVYCVQAGRYITGEEPIAVTAQFGPVLRKELFTEVEESITWQMEFPSGAVCTSTSTLAAGIDRLYASAENGRFELSPAISYGPFKGRTHEKEMDFPQINQQAAQMDAISKIILENKPMPDHISGLEGWKDMKVLDAIYKAAETGKKVRI